MLSNTRLENLPNIHTFAQDAFDTGYLQPYPILDTHRKVIGEVFKELVAVRDGDIARDVHGAMHAGRASLVSVVVYDLFQELFPDSTKASIDDVCQALGITTAQLLWLIRAAVIYHDYMRQDEGNDFWDKQSAAKFAEVLLAQGCPEDICRFMESAAANKDHPAKFTTYCREHFPNVLPPHLDIVRKLIHLSDCLDSLRCRGEFSLNYVAEQLEMLPDYHEDKHFSRFIELAQALHTVIWEQGDMLFDCKITFKGQSIPTEKSGARFLRELKVKYEHAANVTSALANDMQKYAYFSKYFKDEALLDTSLATVKPVFDSFIHGTQSGALAIIKSMRDRGLTPSFTSTLELVQHSCAPVTGELHRKGANQSLGDNAFMCFGRLRLSWNVPSYYSLEKVTDYAVRDAGKYASLDHLKNKTIYEFRDMLDTCLRKGFTYVNMLMIYYLRAKQLGIADNLLMYDKPGIIRAYQSTIQVYYLLMLLGNHIRLDVDAIAKLGSTKQYEFQNEVYEAVSIQTLAELITKLNIDVKSIYENPTEENLKTLLPLFKLPASSKYANLQWLYVTTESPKPFVPHCDYRYDFNMMTRNSDGNGIGTMLVNYIALSPEDRPVRSMHEFIPAYIEQMQQRSALLEQVLSANCPNLLDDAVCQYFMTENFPIILMCQKEDSIPLASFGTHEYRAKRALVLGNDVNIIATDTLEHAVMIKFFLDKNGYSEVGVVLISELTRARLEDCKPKFLFQQEGSRVANLSWLATKSFVPGVVQKRDENDKSSLLDKLEAKANEAEAAYNQNQTRETKRAFTLASNRHKRVEDTTSGMLAGAHKHNKLI